MLRLSGALTASHSCNVKEHQSYEALTNEYLSIEIGVNYIPVYAVPDTHVKAMTVTGMVM
jgi:hypothetical protein